MVLLSKLFGQHMKHLALLMTAVLSTVYVDMYQDRTDKNKTVIIIEKDGSVDTFTVKNSDLNAKLVEKLVKRYETSDKP